ncbi:MAG: glycosyltransferase family 4 protein [Candidatus Brocadiales bacterium]|nr:glycosyltransferase family 4 protein [Candidatus Bathyanammoxibius sp.]
MWLGSGGTLNKAAKDPLSVAFLFPGNLEGEEATAIRARVTIQTVRERVQAHVLAMEGDPTWVKAVSVMPDTPGRQERRRMRSCLWPFTKEVLRWLEVIKPQVIHAITNPTVAPALLYKRRHPETRLVFEMHALAYYEHRDFPWSVRLIHWLLDYWGARRADAVVAMSYTQRDLLHRWYHGRPEKVHVLWGPVDLELFRCQDPPPAPPFLVGYSGNDHFWQGVDTILEAARLLQHQEDIEFLIMGFPEESYLGLGLHNVTFLGLMPREEVPKRLSRCHVLLSPRAGGRVTNSQYPFKLSAYLALGRPIVASAVSDQPRILKQADCGLIIPPGDPRALAEAILQFRQMPERRRLEKGRNARRFAEHHLSLERLANALLGIYNGRGVPIDDGGKSEDRNGVQIPRLRQGK